MNKKTDLVFEYFEKKYGFLHMSALAPLALHFHLFSKFLYCRRATIIPENTTQHTKIGALEHVGI